MESGSNNLQNAVVMNSNNTANTLPISSSVSIANQSLSNQQQQPASLISNADIFELEKSGINLSVLSRVIKQAVLEERTEMHTKIRMEVEDRMQIFREQTKAIASKMNLL